MLKRLFNPDENDFTIYSNEKQRMSPNRGGIHPALCGTTTATPDPDPKESNTPVIDANHKDMVNELKVDSVDVRDSDSDLMEVPGFFSISNQKLPYSKEEDELILKYVLKGQNIFKVSSISLWKHLEAKKENPKRTYQSLKNRFLRNIKPHIFTTYGHLVKDKETTERILAKFPELKHSFGRREVLSRIKLPERRPASKAPEENGVSSTNINEFQANIERATLDPSDAVQREPEPNAFLHPISLNLDVFKPVIYQRIVRAERDGITVCVNFEIKKCVETPFSSTSHGIYRRFKRLEAKNKLVFCATCGRFNLPKKVTPLSRKEGSFLIPSSIVTPKTSKKNYKRSVDSKLNNSYRAKQRKMSSETESLNRSPCSPSLLSDVCEAVDVDNPVASAIKRSSNVIQVSELSNSVTLRSDESEVVDSKKVARKTKSTAGGSKASGRNVVLAATTSSSKKETDSKTENRRSEGDEDSDSIYRDAMANFQKLINCEEEQLLVRKCLNKNFKSIGPEGVSQTNWDSYFLESSSDLDTPPLTIDYESDLQASSKGPDTQTNANEPGPQTNAESQPEDTNGSSLLENMRRVLRGRIKKS